MKAKAKRRRAGAGMRREYVFDYSTAVRGKHYRRLHEEGAGVVVLEPDLAKVFRDSGAVNEALRALLELSASTKRILGGRAPRTRASQRPSGRGKRRPANRPS